MKRDKLIGMYRYTKDTENKQGQLSYCVDPLFFQYLITASVQGFPCESFRMYMVHTIAMLQF